MSTNAPTSRRTSYMRCHVVIWVLKYFFFSKKYFNRTFPIFFLKNISFPLFFPNYTTFSYLLYTLNHLSIRFSSCFTLLIIFQFVIPIYIFYIYIKRTIVKKLYLELFQKTLLIIKYSSTQLESFQFFIFHFCQFLGDLQPNFKKLSLNSLREVFTPSNL